MCEREKSRCDRSEITLLHFSTSEQTNYSQVRDIFFNIKRFFIAWTILRDGTSWIEIFDFCEGPRVRVPYHKLYFFVFWEFKLIVLTEHEKHLGRVASWTKNNHEGFLLQKLRFLRIRHLTNWFIKFASLWKDIFIENYYTNRKAIVCDQTLDQEGYQRSEKKHLL